MDLVRFRKKPVLGILRGIPENSLLPLLDSIVSSGLETVEFAMNSENAPRLIKKTARLCGKKLMVGAGTVLGLKELKTALNAGAAFIVSPVLVRPVAAYCVRHKIPVFPGALTPSEIYEAWQTGATMVKVFPAGCFGPDYFREIRGPFPQIELLACSGVTPENRKDYFKNGASAIAVGSSVFRKEWIEGKKFDLIRHTLRKYLTPLPPR